MVDKWLANNHGCSGAPSLIIRSSLWTSRMEIKFNFDHWMLTDEADKIPIYERLTSQWSQSTDGELMVVRRSPL